jgi:hypothetical protein
MTYAERAVAMQDIGVNKHTGKKLGQEAWTEWMFQATGA